MSSISCRSQKEAGIEETKEITIEIEKIDNMMSDNIKSAQKLKMHESRLRAVKNNPQKYHIQIVIEGRSIYTSADEIAVDEMAYSLALEDLLQSHHAGKGTFQSDDPSVWKNLLIEHSKKALDRLSNVELPGIQRRLNEIEKENIVLESKKRKLFEEYKTLQGKI
jgi:hypothetical protein